MCSGLQEFLATLVKNADGTYSSVGNVIVPECAVSNGRLSVSFDTVNGNFVCMGLDLVTLAGCPKIVGGNFNCIWNCLTSLEYGPEYVGGDYECWSNKLVSLVGSPKRITGFFDCSSNKLVDLEYGPEYVTSSIYVECYFDCRCNKLVSLVGAPKYVGGGFDCSSNELVDVGVFVDLGEVAGNLLSSVKFDVGVVRKLVGCKVRGDIYTAFNIFEL